MKSYVYLTFVLFFVSATTIYAQEEAPEIKEIKKPKKPSGIVAVDETVDAAFALYDAVIEKRKDGDANGYAEKGMSIWKFDKESKDLVKALTKFANPSNLEGNGFQKAKAVLAGKKALSALNNSLKQVKYMKSQFTPEEQAEFEALLKSGDEEAVETEEAAGEETEEGKG